MFSGGIVISGGGTAKYNKIAKNVATYVHTVTWQLRSNEELMYSILALPVTLITLVITNGGCL